MKLPSLAVGNTDVSNFRESLKGRGRAVPGLPQFNPDRVVRQLLFKVFWYELNFFIGSWLPIYRNNSTFTGRQWSWLVT